MNKGEEFPLEPGENPIGRSDGNRICVFDKKSSRVHCMVIVEGENIYVEDNQSTNGTKLNNVFIAGRTKANIGDHIRLGQTVLLLSDKPVELSATDTSKQHQQRKYEVLLDESTFQVTKTTALRKLRSEKDGRDVGFLSFFQKDEK
jgi:pSer/pThr/pTyr-binding forkhead associated (FHA) protein